MAGTACGRVHDYVSNQTEQTVDIRRREVIPGHPETEPEPNLHAAEDRCDCRLYYPWDALGVHLHVRHPRRGRAPHGRAITRSLQGNSHYRRPGDQIIRILFIKNTQEAPAFRVRWQNR